MNNPVSKLSDAELVTQIESDAQVSKAIVDEYYRRCIPLYLDFLGTHWHTGFYQDDEHPISAQDQIRMIDHLAQAIKLKAGQTVLDVGCGLGATPVYLAKQYTVKAIGLTPVYEQMRMAQHLAKTENVKVQIDIAHAESLPYEDQSIDAIMFFESACHFENRAAFFSEAHRVLKSGGWLVGEDWLSTSNQGDATHEKLIQNICKTWAIPMLGTPMEYQNLMVRTGFENVTLVDMRELMPLHRGFAVSAADQAELADDIANCDDALLRLTLKGIACLGKAFNANAFTIGQFTAQKPH